MTQISIVKRRKIQNFWCLGSKTNNDQEVVYAIKSDGIKIKLKKSFDSVIRHYQNVYNAIIVKTYTVKNMTYHEKVSILSFGGSDELPLEFKIG